ncbi:hypothetical protein H0H93_014262 [Arthromyces matolae]|nr:hypothetical protein H0H93_014262 [Arthromyces matolae]
MTCTPARSTSRLIHVVAMWSKSNISRITGMEEWTVFSASDPIHLEAPQNVEDPYLLRYGDTFVIKLYSDKGERQKYMELKTLSIIDPDSPFFVLIRTWSTRNNEVILRIPIGFVSTTVDTLLRHIEKTNMFPTEVTVAPTVIITNEKLNQGNSSRRFLSGATRRTLDPENTMGQYVFLLQDK